MTPPIPPGLARSGPIPPRPRRPLAIRTGDALFTWKRTEPARLYAYAVLAAVLVVLAVVGWITEDLAAALTGVVAAVLAVVPAAAAIRASVYSPATRASERMEDSARWARMVRDREAA
jgi:di/tricarboxylate transporter